MSDSQPDVKDESEGFPSLPKKGDHLVVVEADDSDNEGGEGLPLLGGDMIHAGEPEEKPDFILPARTAHRMMWLNRSLQFLGLVDLTLCILFFLASNEKEEVDQLPEEVSSEYEDILPPCILALSALSMLLILQGVCKQYWVIRRYPFVASIKLLCIALFLLSLEQPTDTEYLLGAFSIVLLFVECVLFAISVYKLNKYRRLNKGKCTVDSA
eukprot:GFYU01029154.1.p1 GENE.GFYU01029154.1~~GFYU01029154.1.p1  ORF type:complete len:212 (+),score=44.82 GFYU01029154.1:147-782(+)